MNELEQWGNGSAGLAPRRNKHAHDQVVKRIMFDAKEVALKIDATAAVTEHLMDRAVRVDQYRRNLAGNDPTLNAILTRIELGFVAAGERYQRDLGSQL